MNLGIRKEKKMGKPYVVAINSVSGGGKTTLAEHLAASLPNAVLFRFDDFDDTNVYPDDFCGARILDFDCPGMVAAVREELGRGSASFIVLDYPFGRDHPCFEREIDFSVFIDTPLDVAMARRILRDFLAPSELSAMERLETLKGDLAHYLAKSRDPYVDHDRHRATCDLVLNGCAGLDQLRDLVLERIKSESAPSTD